jgi:hypothetical protein
MKSVRIIIRNIINEMFLQENLFQLEEDFRYRYDGSFEPEEGMIHTAQEALNAVNKNDLTKDVSNPNEGSGKSKANSIIKKEPFSHSQLKRMKAFFDNREEEYKKEKISGKTIENSGIMQIWGLWGGDAARAWCEKKLKQRNSSNNTSKTVRGASGIRTKTLMDTNNTRIHK